MEPGKVAGAFDLGGGGAVVTGAARGIGRSAAALLADAVRSGLQLKSLDLIHNRIGDDGCVAVMDALCATGMERLETLTKEQSGSRRRRQRRHRRC